MSDRIREIIKAERAKWQHSIDGPNTSDFAERVARAERKP